MRTIFIVGFGVLVSVVGCNKSGGAAAAGSLTQAQLDDAYKLADADNIDKSLTAVSGKLGAAQKTEGDTSIWFGTGKDGTSCYQLKISKTKGIESGSTDKANCGLK